MTTYYVVFHDSNEVVNLEEMMENIIDSADDATADAGAHEDEGNGNQSTQPLEINLYKIYGNKMIGEIDFNELKLVNNEVKAWIIVDGTNINYPVVQTVNNDYYLNHNINKKRTSNGGHL